MIEWMINHWWIGIIGIVVAFIVALLNFGAKAIFMQRRNGRINTDVGFVIIVHLLCMAVFFLSNLYTIIFGTIFGTCKLMQYGEVHWW